MLRFVLALAAFSLSGSAVAQTRQFNFTFDGTVSSTPDQGARQFSTPNGSTTAGSWTTPSLGAYPVRTGENLTVLFSGTLPVFRDYAFQSVRQPDGSYRLGVVGPNNAAGAGFAYVINNIVVGTLGSLSGSGQLPGISGFDLLYNPATGAASLDFGPDGGFGAGNFNLPAYVLSADGTSANAAGRTIDPSFGSANTTSLTGTADSLSFSDAAIRQATPTDASGLSGGRIVGQQSGLTVRGTFNIPTGSSGSAQVPEPDFIILFAGGAAAMLWRRRKLRQKAA
jgi:PEP-CTERM motif